MNETCMTLISAITLCLTLHVIMFDPDSESGVVSLL